MSKQKNAEELKELDVNEVNEYLGIDFEDDQSKRRIQSLITVADAFLKGAIGDNYPKTDPRARELSLMIIGDLYDNRTLSAKQQNAYRKMAADFEWQLKLEGRQ